MTPKDHSKLLGILFLVYGGFTFFILIAVGLFFLFAGGAVAVNAKDQDAVPLAVFFGIMLGVLLLISIIFAPVLVAGWKLVKMKPSARIWAIVAAILVLPTNFPFGLALGIYALIFLFSDDAKHFFASGGKMTGFNPPPPPHHWR